MAEKPFRVSWSNWQLAELGNRAAKDIESANIIALTLQSAASVPVRPNTCQPITNLFTHAMFI